MFFGSTATSLTPSRSAALRLACRKSSMPCSAMIRAASWASARRRSSARWENFLAIIKRLLRSRQKPRFLPAETKLMSDKRAGARLDGQRSARRVPSRDGKAQKAPQATFSSRLAQRSQKSLDVVAALQCLDQGGADHDSIDMR